MTPRRSFFKSLALIGAAAIGCPGVFIPKFEAVRWKRGVITQSELNFLGHWEPFGLMLDEADCGVSVGPTPPNPFGEDNCQFWIQTFADSSPKGFVFIPERHIYESGSIVKPSSVFTFDGPPHDLPRNLHSIWQRT